MIWRWTVWQKQIYSHYQSVMIEFINREYQICCKIWPSERNLTDSTNGKYKGNLCIRVSRWILTRFTKYISTSMVTSGLVICDDVIVYNDTWIEHLATTRKFCDRLTDVFVNSEFCCASVTLLGYFVGHGQI